MDYKFDDKYVVESLEASVRDEGIRIVQADLAPEDQVGALVEPLVSAAKKYLVSPDGFATFAKNLGVLHSGLCSVKLPGDFEKMAEDLKSSYYFQPYFEQTAEEQVVDDEDDLIIDDVFDPISAAYDETKNYVLEKLADIVYEFGSEGKHEAAYLVERKINEIKAYVQKKK